jgi:fumarate hydratase class II
VTGFKFVTAPNKFAALASHEPLVAVHVALKTLVQDRKRRPLDGEITIPENKPGSSMIPRKVNPTQCESMTMVCVRVFGNDVVINMGGASGNFELNVFKPVIMEEVIQSVKILTGSMTFNKKVRDWNLTAEGTSRGFHDAVPDVGDSADAVGALGMSTDDARATIRGNATTIGALHPRRTVA